MSTPPPPNINIIGCGWQGLAVLRALVAAGHRVGGSARRPEQLAAIRAAGGRATFLELPGPLPADFLPEAGWLLIALPPRGRQLGAAAVAHYLAVLASLQPWLRQGGGGRRVIFLSSTGAYGDSRGAVTEATPLRATTHSGRAVVAAEEWLARQPPPLTILRLGGLIGPGRHPGHFYGGKDRPIPAADAPVNLVHQEDVVRAVQLVIRRNLTGIFNVCAAAHPPKGTFYAQAAARLGLRISGKLAGGSEGKIVRSRKLRRAGWEPRFDDLALE